MNPNVAIVSTNFNYGAYVIKAINSALSQDYDGDIKISNIKTHYV